MYIFESYFNLTLWNFTSKFWVKLSHHFNMAFLAKGKVEDLVELAETSDVTVGKKLKPSK